MHPQATEMESIRAVILVTVVCLFSQTAAQGLVIFITKTHTTHTLLTPGDTMTQAHKIVKKYLKCQGMTSFHQIPMSFEPRKQI